MKLIIFLKKYLFLRNIPDEKDKITKSSKDNRIKPRRVLSRVNLMFNHCTYQW